MESSQPPEFDPVAMWKKVMSNAETRTGTPRHVLNAGLLGVCVVFLVGLLTLPRLDGPLTVALDAFAVAVPCLALGYMIGAFQFKKEPGSLYEYWATRSVWVLEAIFGQLAVGVGFVAILVHFGPSPVIAFIAATAVFIILTNALALSLALAPLLDKPKQSPQGSSGAGQASNSNPPRDPDIPSNDAGRPDTP
jgi:hypothetical protein